ncbi:MAG: acyl-CoA dehydrogenase family protein [Granulosicoccus sp.]
MPSESEEWVENVRMLTESAGAIVPVDGDLSRVRSQRWIEPGYSREVWASIADMDWLAPTWPQSLGGMGLDATRQLMQVTGSLAGVRLDDDGDRRHDVAGT